jgi:replicative DNA helicase
MPPERVLRYERLLAQYAQERSGPQFEPIRLGWGSIDADTRGISSGQVMAIAARTSVGKTWVLNSINEFLAGRDDCGVLTLSLEMPGAEWAERQFAIAADVAPEQVEEWARGGELAAKVGDFLERMQSSLVVEDSLSIGELPAVFEEARSMLSVPLRCVLIDYLTLLDANGRDAYERASALGKGLKTLAKAQKVAIVVAAQTNRDSGDGSQPVTIAMLRDSGVLEESVDFLLGCWRPGRDQTLDPPDALNLRDVVRVAILKNRKGQDGRVVDLRFRPESRRVYEPYEVV